ncbi:hypothetical protein A2U01_0114486, partial [Trifolium medium]|nr:hypothetical protein [Trifolium medium]
MGYVLNEYLYGLQEAQVAGPDPMTEMALAVSLQRPLEQ